ncbi:hypothetical protein B0F90DRAFT_715499 [Multifurca ochricompacta]|uniref:Uncharacterized protein n=1 Tax=Multifurca ochricompacta TaxID=376703 RepID=A0AAD4M239_9AGAM|nr:hypothetical protein B0F90DRAFT_715499 [Multifurca ochricompacta]
MISAYSASCSSRSSSDSLPPETPVGFEFSGRGNEALTPPNLDLQVDSDSFFCSDLTSMDNHPTEFSNPLSGESQTLTALARIPSRVSRCCRVAPYAKLTPSQRVKAKRHEKTPKVVHPLDRLPIEGSMLTVRSVALDTFGNSNLSDAPQILGWKSTAENSDDLETGCYGDLGYLGMVPMVRSALFVTCSNTKLERT